MSKPYLIIVVRAKKDKDSITHVLENYYPSWRDLTQVVTLGGERSAEKAAEKIRDLARLYPTSYIAVLVGREDYHEVAPLRETEQLANVSIHVLRTSKLRNMRPLEAAVNLEKAKARLRLKLSWIRSTKCYELGYSAYRSSTRIEIPPHPLYDIYFVVGRKHADLYSRCIKARLPPVFLVIKRVHDEHDIVVSSRRVAEIVIPENSEPYARYVSPAIYRESLERMDLGSTVDVSASKIKHHERIAESLLRQVCHAVDPDRVIVPWSGGKDSTAALILALKVFGKDKVTPIFVDTGLDLPLNLHYVHYVSEVLGISVEIEHAGIDRELERRDLPTHENRWCTKLKIRALYRAIRRVAKRPLIVVGDRDNESLLRLKRAPIRTHEGYHQVAPLKFWSSALVQLYVLMNKIPLNPLYQIGFYRLGCYICPAYRVWELDIAESILREENYDELFRDLLREQSYLIYQASQS